MGSKAPYKIILADDHILIRHGIKNIISQSSDLAVVGEVNNGEELLHLLKTEEADLIILDIAMPKIGGIQSIKLVRESYPQVRILILTMYKTRQHYSHAMGAGADGYLLKDDSDKELLVAITRIREGRKYISPFLAEDFADAAISSYQNDKSSPFQELTKREKEVLQWVVDGLTSKQMADRLGLSPRTIDHHRANLLKKFDKKNSVDLVNFVVRNGLVTPEKY